MLTWLGIPTRIAGSELMFIVQELGEGASRPLPPRVDQRSCPAGPLARPFAGTGPRRLARIYSKRSSPPRSLVAVCSKALPLSETHRDTRG